MKIIKSITHYNIKYEPLYILVKQLVKDSLELLTPKEIIRVLWSFAKHSKADTEFYESLCN